MIEIARTYCGLAAEFFEFELKEWPGGNYMQLMKVGFFLDTDLLIYHAMVKTAEPNTWSEPVFFGNISELKDEWFHEPVLKNLFNADVEQFKSEGFLVSHFEKSAMAKTPTPADN